MLKSNHYFGMFRIQPDANREIQMADGTVKSLPVVSNPIDSGIADIRFEGKRLTNKLAKQLWKRDKNQPFITNNIG